MQFCRILLGALSHRRMNDAQPIQNSFKLYGNTENNHTVPSVFDRPQAVCLSCALGVLPSLEPPSDRLESGSRTDTSGARGNVRSSE